ncbi:MAG: hypothetical protein PVH61_28975 [Candidatus Aminicenantes bacterium]
MKKKHDCIIRWLFYKYRLYRFPVEKDTMEWLLNLEKYSKIKDYTLTSEEAEKIWDTVGGSMWEIQYLLGQLFEHSIDKVLPTFKEEISSLIAYYTEFDKNKRQVLQVVNEKEMFLRVGPWLKLVIPGFTKIHRLFF